MTLTPRAFNIVRGETTNKRVEVLTEDELADAVYMYVWVHDRAEALAELAWATGKTGDLHKDVSVEEVR